MSLQIVLPVKPFSEAKQRFASAMSASARLRLAEKMFRHVFATASAFAGPRAIIVVSRGSDVLNYARTQGAVALAEPPTSDLNTALRQAAEFARGAGASRLLVLASDLPLLCEEDLAAIVVCDCAIAPDRHQHGTNALLWPASSLPGFHFGENSFSRHREAARAAGLHPDTVFRTGLAHDVDLPSDLIAPDE